MLLCSSFHPVEHGENLLWRTMHPSVISWKRQEPGHYRLLRFSALDKEEKAKKTLTFSLQEPRQRINQALLNKNRNKTQQNNQKEAKQTARQSNPTDGDAIFSLLEGRRFLCYLAWVPAAAPGLWSWSAPVNQRIINQHP